MRGKIIAQQVFPRIKFEQFADHAGLGVGKLPSWGDANLFQIDEMRTHVGGAGSICHHFHGCVIFNQCLDRGEVDVRVARENMFEPRGQRLEDPVELIAVGRQSAARDHVLEPGPLK